MYARDISPVVFHAARSGDAAALGHLLRSAQPDIRRYAQRSCTASDVDDAVQEALFILSRHLVAVRHAAALSAWLFRVVTRECRRLARRVLRIDLWQEEKVEALLSTRSEDRLRLDVAAALQSLPEHYREVIVLRDFEELTIGEIATRLSLSRAAVKSRLHRARQLTREYLLS
jgi:RNA polymerase sigma factor (sigma-70 family)